MATSRLRIGYVPEHFSAPLMFAHKYYGLDAELVPVPLGTGDMVMRLKCDKEARSDYYIDIGLGLTEGFVRDLGRAHNSKEAPAFNLVGTYVRSPLCWALSTGADRDDINSLRDVRGKRVGVSRMGSGSHIMAAVMAEQYGWLGEGGGGGGDGVKDAFAGFQVVGDFASLRKSVQRGGEADFFMWEHFTTKHYWEAGELKRVGEIFTPWPSWMIAARHSAEEEAQTMMAQVNRGARHFEENPEEAVRYITSEMRYSTEDVKAWMKTVKFADDVRTVDASMMRSTLRVLQTAGVS